MKKILCFVAILMFAYTGVGFAAALSSGTVSSPASEIHSGSDTGPLIGKLSAGVRMELEYGATTYAVATAHDKGTKIFGTAAGDTKIYTQDKAGDAILSAILSASDTSAFDTGWTEM